MNVRARLIVLSVAAVAAFLIVLLAGVDRRLMIEILLLLSAAFLLHTLLRLVASRERGAQALPVAAIVRSRRARPALPEAYESLHNRVILGQASAADFHRHIRPLLRAAAAERLRARRIDLDREPERARSAVGDELWELIRPPAEIPRDPSIRGAPVRRIRAALDTIERI